MTRVVADVPDDFDGSLDSPEGEKIIEVARKQMLTEIENYLNGENCDRLEEDFECPYKEDTRPVLTGEDGKRYEIMSGRTPVFRRGKKAN